MVNTPRLVMRNSLQFNGLNVFYRRKGAPRREKGSTIAGEIPGLGITQRFDSLGTPMTRYEDRILNLAETKLRRGGVFDEYFVVWGIPCLNDRIQRRY